jgi:hypothetical protein
VARGPKKIPERKRIASARKAAKARCRRPRIVEVTDAASLPRFWGVMGASRRISYLEHSLFAPKSNGNQEPRGQKDRS